MTSPKRHLTAITRVDAATVARLTVEERTLHRIYQRALEDWLDCRDRLRDAEKDAQNANELRDVVMRAERTRAA